MRSISANLVRGAAVGAVLVWGACSPTPTPSITDAGIDAGIDAGPHIIIGGFDANGFNTPDSGMHEDAGHDAGEDAGHDAGEDAGIDAGEDAGIDAGHDAGEDAGIDAGIDAGVDAGPNDGGPCVPETDSQICQNTSPYCGSISTTDNCGFSRSVSCVNPCPVALETGNFLVAGVTADGYVITVDVDTGEVDAISLTSGDTTPTQIMAAATPAPTVLVSNYTVFLWTAVTSGTYPTGSLSTWVSGTLSGPAANTLVGTAFGSEDDSVVVYVNSVSSGSGTGTVVGADNDLSSPTTLKSGVYLPTLTAGVSAYFTESGFILGYQTSSSSTVNIESWDESWTAHVLATGTSGLFTADPGGDTVAYLDSSDNLWTVPFLGPTTVPPLAEVAAASPVTLDGLNASFTLIESGDEAIYLAPNSGSKGLKYATNSWATITTLLGTGVGALLGASPENDMAAFAETVSSDCTDLWMTPIAAPPGTSGQVGSSECAAFGSVLFTADETQLVWINSPSSGTGTLYSSGLTNNGTSITTTAPTPWLTGAGPATAIDNATIVFPASITANSTAGAPASEDLEYVDLSGTDPASRLAQSVDSTWYVTTSPGAPTVVYTISSYTANHTSTDYGIYTVTLP